MRLALLIDTDINNCDLDLSIPDDPVGGVLFHRHTLLHYIDHRLSLLHGHLLNVTLTVRLPTGYKAEK